MKTLFAIEGKEATENVQQCEDEVNEELLITLRLMLRAHYFLKKKRIFSSVCLNIIWV